MKKERPRQELNAHDLKEIAAALRHVSDALDALARFGKTLSEANIRAEIIETVCQLAERGEARPLREWLEDLEGAVIRRLVARGANSHAIAAVLGCSLASARQYLHRRQIRLRNGGRDVKNAVSA